MPSAACAAGAGNATSRPATDAGVDIATVALWLGHQNVATTQIYTPTSRSKNGRLPGPLRKTSPPDVTDLQTSSSPSSTGYKVCRLQRRIRHLHGGNSASVGITARSA